MNSMETVGLSEARARWPELLERVSKGETIMITKHGTPMARLVPSAEELPKRPVEEALLGQRESERDPRLKAVTIVEPSDEGRKY